MCLLTLATDQWWKYIYSSTVVLQFWGTWGIYMYIYYLQQLWCLRQTQTHSLPVRSVCVLRCSPTCIEASTPSEPQVAWSLAHRHTSTLCVTHSHHSLFPLFICLNVWEAAEQSGKAPFIFSSLATRLSPSLPSLLKSNSVYPLFLRLYLLSCLPSFLLF